jgi:hypothetical protein
LNGGSPKPSGWRFAEIVTSVSRRHFGRPWRGTEKIERRKIVSETTPDGVYTDGPVPTYRDVLDAAKKFTQFYKPVPPMTFVMHPANRDAFDEIVASVSQPAFGCKVFMEDGAPIRSIRKKWHPPAGDRFTEYGPEDEEWMRPLGLGRIEEIDEGPVIFALDMGKLWDDVMKPLPLTGIFGGIKHGY